MKQTWIIRPRSVFLFISCLLFAVLIVQAGFSLEDAAKKGLVTYVEGMAKKQKLQDVDWLSVAENTPVISGERVRTFSESRAELELAKMDRIRMAPKTTIDILKLYEESKEQVRESTVLLQSGDIWANIAKKDEKVKFSINTPVAAAAITGTTLRLSADADSTAELKVYTGEVVISNVPADSVKTVKKASLQPYQVEGPKQIAGPREVSMQEWTLIVKSMQKVRVNKHGQIQQTGSFSSSDPDEQSDWVKWNQEMDRRP